MQSVDGWNLQSQEGAGAALAELSNNIPAVDADLDWAFADEQREADWQTNYSELFPLSESSGFTPDHQAGETHQDWVKPHNSGRAYETGADSSGGPGGPSSGPLVSSLWLPCGRSACRCGCRCGRSHGSCSPMAERELSPQYETHLSCGSKRHRTHAVSTAPRYEASDSVFTSPKKRVRRYNDAGWARMLARLAVYKEHHGACNVALSPGHVRP
jgi:hypothetical protein